MGCTWNVYGMYVYVRFRDIYSGSDCIPPLLLKAIVGVPLDIDTGGLPVGKKPKPKGSKASNQPNQPK